MCVWGFADVYFYEVVILQNTFFFGVRANVRSSLPNRSITKYYKTTIQCNSSNFSFIIISVECNWKTNQTTTNEIKM